MAMTGEVTLRGRVLPIGGLKEKLLAARMAQVEKVLVPAKNQPDVEELSKEITKGMEHRIHQGAWTKSSERHLYRRNSGLVGERI